MERKAYTVSIPSAGHVKETDYAGMASGRDTDKWQAKASLRSEANSSTPPMSRSSLCSLSAGSFTRPRIGAPHPFYRGHGGCEGRRVGARRGRVHRYREGGSHFFYIPGKRTYYRHRPVPWEGAFNRGRIAEDAKVIPRTSHVRGAPSRLTSSLYHQDGSFHIPVDHAVGDAAEDRGCESTFSVGTHNDQVRFRLLGLFHDILDRVSCRKDDLRLDTLFIAQFFNCFPMFLGSFLERGSR